MEPDFHEKLLVLKITLQRTKTKATQLRHHIRRHSFIPSTKRCFNERILSSLVSRDLIHLGLRIHKEYANVAHKMHCSLNEQVPYFFGM